MKNLFGDLARHEAHAGFFGHAILSLALGIGANTAIFSLLDQFLLRNAAGEEPAGTGAAVPSGSHAGQLFEAMKREGRRSAIRGSAKCSPGADARSRALAAASGLEASMASRNSAVPGTAVWLSGNYLTAGVQPTWGACSLRTTTASKAAIPSFCFSSAYWLFRSEAMFRAEPDHGVPGYPMTIVGVAQKGFLSEHLADSPEIYRAPYDEESADSGWDAFHDRKTYWISLFGRLKPGVTMAQADARDQRDLPRPTGEGYSAPQASKPESAPALRAKKIILRPGEYGRGGLREQSQEPLLLLIGMTAMVLLICCANVANLQLARRPLRARGRSPVRLADGAPARS